VTAIPIVSAAPALPAVRQRYALELLRRFGVVRCHELEFRFGISEATARRDIDAVVRRGYGERVYGGAVLADNPVPSRATQGHASVMR
jgi:DeoR/GlpR family transcriptional regulator of sugar metabolism